MEQAQQLPCQIQIQTETTKRVSRGLTLALIAVVFLLLGLGAQVSHPSTPESGIHRARGPPSLVPQCLAPPESSSPSLGPEAPAASPATLPTQQLQAPISQGTKVLTCVLAASGNGACK